MKCTAIKHMRAGDRFGMLVVLDRAENDKHNSAMWNTLCDCGTKGIIRGTYLRSGNITSCGCVRRARRLAGRSRTWRHPSPVHSIWKHMNRRCHDPQRKDFYLYGGRGIKVCERWRKSVMAFTEDMGARPSLKHTLDRIDPNGDYCPSNCRWATMAEQNRNRRDNRFVVVNGKSMTVSEWAVHTGTPVGVLFGRINSGWNPVDAIVTPYVRGKKARRRYDKCEKPPIGTWPMGGVARSADYPAEADGASSY